MTSKKLILAGIIALTMSSAALKTYAQVGINTETPAATFDVVANKTDGTTAEGLIAPRLTGDQIKAKDAQYGTAQNGVIVFATSAVTAPSAKTQNVTQKGYYYYDAAASNGSGTGLWVAIGTGGASAVKTQFYMPSIVLPTDPSTMPDATNYSYSGSTFTVNLYNIYKQQYGYTVAGSSARSLSSATLNSFDADKLNYFVIYYDNTVFQSVAVSAAGVLTYQLKSGYTVTEKTFMNIMFQEK
ncbi:MAG: hypothetical protein FWF72_02790 [Paludibacter sp.]|nr:hypothetical protein [Paludibacter sp.]